MLVDQWKASEEGQDMLGKRLLNAGALISRWRAYLAPLLLGACTLAFAAPALGDSITLSIVPEPVESVTSQVSYVSNSAEPSYTTVMVNKPSVACAPNPRADDGQTVIAPFGLEGETGQYGDDGNFTFGETGAYTLCGWVEEPGEYGFSGGGAITATSVLPLQVRLPKITLSLHFPRPVVPGRGFALELLATSEVKREVVVEGMPYTRRGCPVNYAASEESHLIETEVDGGPSTSVTDVKPLSPGVYIFCAWADPTEDGGLDPEARASIVLNLTRHAHATPRKRRPAHKRGHGHKRR
jgi:hypothetical protein